MCAVRILLTFSVIHTLFIWEFGFDVVFERKEGRGAGLSLTVKVRRRWDEQCVANTTRGSVCIILG